jgi:putative selenate reductase molybdopterin-binding subunit
MEVEFRINGVVKSLEVAANESLLAALRREGYYSVRHGCETGECGACTVLIDGLPRPACVTFAALVGGCTLTTVENLGTAHALHPLQQAFVDTGAVYCGFCTPGMLLSAYALLKGNPNPSEEEVRDALSGHICCCTGYLKPVQAVLRAAAVMRGETVEAVEVEQSAGTIKLVTGRAAFVDDIELRGMLYARLLTSPHAHAVIRDIDVSEARALPGVVSVLTYRDIARVPYAGTGLSATATGPRDQYSLDYIVRFAGDRVAAIAAETPEIAEQALRLIRVDYETLPAVLDPRRALEPGAPRLHSETDSSGIFDSTRNIAVHMTAETGHVERAFAEADLLVEGDYVLPPAQQAPIENHIAITYLDEDERLVVRTSAESAYAVQHIIAPLIDLPPRRIRVVTPRVGGSFGAKQGILVEDICALLTLATRRPVKLEYSRADEFRSSRALPAQFIQIKTGVRRDGTLVANQVTLLAGIGAYGSFAPSLLRGAGLNTLSLYACPNLRYVADAVYTNLPPAAASRDSGAFGAIFALESHMDVIAKQLGIDALELRRRNCLKPGDENLLAKAFGENGESVGPDRHDDQSAYVIAICNLPQCIQVVEEQLGWKEKRGKGDTGRYRHGVGAAVVMCSAPAPGSGKSGASIKLNEDGSFTLLAGAVADGSQSIIAEVAAHTLSVRIEDIILHTADTDVTPFESSVDAAASTAAAAGAVMKAAEQVRAQLLEAAGRLLKVEPGTLTLEDRVITALNGDTLTVAQVASRVLYAAQEPPIVAYAAETDARVSPIFAAQGAEVEVDTETGAVRVLRAITALDAGRVINPIVAECQAEGSAAQALGMAISEEMLHDQRGAPLTASLSDYRVYSAPEMPYMETHFIESPAPSGSFVPTLLVPVSAGGLAPAIANAVADALGIGVRQLPLTPDRVLQAIRAQAR